MRIGKQQELDKSFRGNQLHQVSDDLSLQRATSHTLRPIRVLAFLESRTIAGAVKPVLEFVAEATETKAAGIEVTLVCYLRREQENELTQTIRSRGIQLQLIEERHPFDLKVVNQLQALVERLQPGIIWTNNSKSHFLVRVSGVDRSAEWVAFHHGYTREALRSRFYNQLDRWSLRHASRVVTVCQKFALDLQHIGVAPARVSVGPNPIRPPLEGAAAQTKQEARLRLGVDASCTLLLCVGRLSAEKGHLDLLHAMSSLKATHSGAGPLKLFIVGNGPLQEKLERVSKEFGLDDVVTFTGYRSDVQSYYRAGDVFVLPSLSEGCPNVLLEAMCAGLPVVATDAGGVPEIAINGRNALVVPRHNPSQLAAALETILSNVDLRKRLADASQEVVQQHSPSAYFQEITTIFQDVLRDSRCAARSNGLHS